MNMTPNSLKNLQFAIFWLLNQGICGFQIWQKRLNLLFFISNKIEKFQSMTARLANLFSALNAQKYI